MAPGQHVAQRRAVPRRVRLIVVSRCHEGPSVFSSNTLCHTHTNNPPWQQKSQEKNTKTKETPSQQTKKSNVQHLLDVTGRLKQVRPAAMPNLDHVSVLRSEV